MQKVKDKEKGRHNDIMFHKAFVKLYNKILSWNQILWNCEDALHLFLYSSFQQFNKYVVQIVLTDLLPILYGMK